MLLYMRSLKESMLIGYIDYKQLSFCKKDPRDRLCLGLDKGHAIDGVYINSTGKKK